MWVVEEVSVGVSVVFNFIRLLFAIQIWEVTVGAGGEAFCTAITILSDLLVQWVVAHHSYSSHGADWPKEEAQKPLNEVQSHMLWHVFLLVTVIQITYSGGLI